MAAAGDFRVTITIRNGKLLRAMRDAGFQSVSKFCRHYNLSYVRTIKYFTLKEAPYRLDGRLRESASNLCDALGMDVSDLFPSSFLEHALKSNSVSVDMDESQIGALAPPPSDPERLVLKDEAAKRVLALTSQLSPRDRAIIGRRFGLDGFREQSQEEVALAIGIGRGAVNAAENKALDRLRIISKSKRPDRKRVQVDDLVIDGVWENA